VQHIGQTHYLQRSLEVLTRLNEILGKKDVLLFRAKSAVLWKNIILLHDYCLNYLSAEVTTSSEIFCKHDKKIKS
jgi:hypothetical protein